MAGLLSALLRPLMPRIIVETTIDAFVFITNRKQLTLRTFVHLTNDNARPKLLSVGEEPAGEEPSVRIDLFSSSLANVPLGTREELTTVFIRFGFTRVPGRRALVQPIVHFKGTGRLNSLLGQETNPILRKCAIAAGADEVHFNSKVICWNQVLPWKIFS